MRDEQLIRYDSNDYLPSTATMERIVKHLQVALKAEGAPPAQIINAARVCAKFNLEPAHDVHLYEAYGSWVLDIGVRAFQTSADRWEKETGDKLIFDAPRRLTDEEARADLGDQWNDAVVGVEILCVKMSQIRAFRLMGREVPMTAYRGYHFGARAFRKRDGSWVPDRKPGSSETLEMQARRRAKKKAYANEVGLHGPPVSHADWRLLEDQVSQADREERHARKMALADQNYTTVDVARDVDGDIIFAAGHEVDNAPDDSAAHIGMAQSEELPAGDLAVSGAPPNPPRFGSATEAQAWGVEVGAFPDLDEAAAAYDEIKREHRPATAGEMFALWTDACRRQTTAADEMR